MIYWVSPCCRSISPNLVKLRYHLLVKMQIFIFDMVK